MDTKMVNFGARVSLRQLVVESSEALGEFAQAHAEYETLASVADVYTNSEEGLEGLVHHPNAPPGTLAERLARTAPGANRPTVLKTQSHIEHEDHFSDSYFS
mmetsp:Transcript_11091/g.25882  ORF Transcript_11091/g.25882 Transcript_11091/m.25882 type:complete len:102 (+) Transcript_11091:224-529(+)